VLAIMERDDAPLLATRAGATLTASLRAIDGVANVRGLGLLLAAELDAGYDSRPIAAAALEGGLVVNAVTPQALRLAPPLTVSDDEIDEAMTILAKAMPAGAPA
jgi:acetylornithine/succinyldiaminopimelate/putrescine aminotransferase